MDVARRAMIEIVGESGTLRSYDPWAGAEPRIELQRAGEAPEAVPVEAANPYSLELDDLARAIRGGGAPRLGRADAAGQARTIEALYRAAREARATRLG
jgi:predicted dehydrogenase